MSDKDDCSVYAIAFLCRKDPEDVRYRLGQLGRRFHDGATDKQIRAAIRSHGFDLKRYPRRCKTIRAFARAERPGDYLITTADHVVAVIDGHVCGRVRDSDLMRIERVDKIFQKPFDFSP